MNWTINHVELTPLLTVDDAAKRLNVSRGLVYALIRSKELPSIKIGSTLRIDPEALDAFISNRQTS